jgi:hypothetical protein
MTVEVASADSPQPVSKGLLLTVRTYTRKTEFGPHIGEVIAQGVVRRATGELAASQGRKHRHPKDDPVRLAPSWLQLAQTLGTEAFSTDARERYAEFIALYEAAMGT